MRRKILIIFTGHMDVGGIEKSLLGLLDSLDYDKYDIDLFLYGHHGSLFSLVNPRVNLLPEVKELAWLRESFLQKIKHGCYYSAILRLRDEYRSRFAPVNIDDTWAQVMRKTVRPLEKHYDLAISFFRPFDFLIEKVDAKRKVGWIHTDYGKTEDLDDIRRDFERVDTIVGVSDRCAESFKKAFPELSDRVIVIENILSEEYVHNHANESDAHAEMPNNGSIKLLSIGRFCEAKNFDNIPDICSKIRKSGLDINWYLIGYGSEEELIYRKIKESRMEKYIIILGKKENPYPYIKACDLYVQPSRYEGKCVTVREAQMLGKPVVITNYNTSASQLEDGVDGIIVPMDNEGCANGISELLKDPVRMLHLSTACKKRDYSNCKEIEKVYRLIEE